MQKLPPLDPPVRILDFLFMMSVIVWYPVKCVKLSDRAGHHGIENHSALKRCGLLCQAHIPALMHFLAFVCDLLIYAYEWYCVGCYLPNNISFVIGVSTAGQDGHTSNWPCNSDRKRTRKWSSLVYLYNIKMEVFLVCSQRSSPSCSYVQLVLVVYQNRN